MDERALQRDRLLQHLRRTATAVRKSQTAIGRVDRGGALPLSFAQQRLWFIDHLEGGSTAYHLGGIFRLSGLLDSVALRRALDTIVARHETLRTTFAPVQGEVRQLIRETARFALHEIDLRRLAPLERDAQVEKQVADECRDRFDLSEGPLIRGRLLRLTETEHVLILTVHHVVSDGWSVGVLLGELRTLYATYRDGGTNPLPPLAVQYADYAVWQRGWLQGEVLQEQVEYWKRQLAGAPVLLELPTDRPRPTAQRHRGESIEFAFDEALSERAKALSQRHDATLIMTLYAALAVVLSRLSGQEDVIIGVPVANRQRVEVEALIGFFVNVLALRVQASPSETVSDLLSRVRTLMLGGYTHQEVPFEHVVEILQPPRSLSHSPIFQVTLTWQDAPPGQANDAWLPGIRMTPQAMPNATSKFDLSWAFHEVDGHVCGTVHYASDLFDRTTIERWIGHLRCVLGEMARDAQASVRSLSLLDPPERARLLREFNATEARGPQEETVHELFEAQARRTPDALAVLHDGRQITYAELNRKANQLARCLRRHGVVPDRPVALCMERGPEMIVGLLGVLKAGGAYVPLDASYPRERLEYMLADAAPAVLLTQQPLKSHFPGFSGPCISLDQDWPGFATEASGDLDPAATGVTAKHLAYVIYTSGSTGRPKGVMVEHRNLLNLVGWHCRAFDVAPGDRSPCTAGSGFDACTWEIWPPLCAGATLVLPAERLTRDPEGLLEWWRNQRLEQSFLATPLAELALTRGIHNPHLRTLLVGGDCLRHRPRATESYAFINNYGPTECAVVATSGRIHGNEPVLHIGRPISNVQIYILDAEARPVPIGVAGEIYIGGAGVARGYLNNPQLTDARFVKDPFGPQPNARLYRTGDIARWLADGNIEYLRRDDGQIKIRGYRIELGEIEAQLACYERVREAVVLALQAPEGEPRLVAYVTVKGETSARELRQFLRGRLPEYMVPSAFVMLETLPLTPNGKVDRRALPTPDRSAFAAREYEAPLGEVEEGLATLWRELLRVERVGRRDEFFELGGHSLLIMQLLERMQRLGLKGTVRDVFEHPALCDLAAAVSGLSQDSMEVPPNLIDPASETITPAMVTLVQLTQAQLDRIVSTVENGARNVQDIYPLAPFQEGVLVHHLLLERGDTYVQPTLLEVRSRAELDAMVKALQEVIDRHDLLRSAVLWEDLPRPVQVVYRHAGLVVEELAIDPASDASTEMRRRMEPQRLRLDVRRAPLVRLQVTRAADGGRWYALLLQHHLINDHVGQELLLKELIAHLGGRAAQLPDPVGYRSFVWRALAQADSKEAESFFRSKLSDVEEPTAPFGLVDVRGDGSEILQADEWLESVFPQRVRELARRFGVTPATLFHAAWALVIARTSNRDDIVFGSVLLGRMRGWTDIDRVMGMFINTLPLRIPLRGLNAEDLVRRIQRELVELLQHEHASLAAVQRCSGIAGNQPLFSAVLNYRHSSPVRRAAALEESGIRVLDFQERSNYPFLIAVTDFGDAFRVVAQTDPRVDPQRVVRYLHTALTSLMEALEHGPDALALELNILPEAERRRVLLEFNATDTPRSSGKLIHELFEDHADRAPNAVALIYEGRQLTYRDLNRQSNQLAHYLRRHGIGVDQPVALHAERGFEMIVGCLAILKAGGAYLPLDPGYPKERLDYMLADAAPRVLLTQSHLSERFADFAGQRIELDGHRDRIEREAESNLDVSALGLTSKHLAYVIHTSGSTGVPKGVAAPHRGLVNRVAAQADFAPFSANDVCCHKTSIGFVDSIVEALGPLSHGLPLVIASGAAARNAESLAALIESQRVTWLITVPSLARSLLEASGDSQRLSTLRHWTLSGEALTPTVLRSLQTALPDCRFVNLYGSSEVAADATFHVSHGSEGERVPIGRPMANTRVYILDERRQPVPIGVRGEIHVAGAGVARGYLNKPELTAERFVEDPFSVDTDARLYRMGDIGRWLPDGKLEYLGRNDSQIKILGHRIELGEIEAQLARHDHVREVAVIAQAEEGGDQRLIAYVTLKGEASPANLKDFLRTHVPEYMVPSAYVVLDSLPLTPGGKLDHRALPGMTREALAAPEYEAPQGDEAVLAGIWRELLRVERVGRRDDFFELGGNSLLALQLVIRVRSQFSVDVPLLQVFELPTLAELAACIDAAVIDLKRYEAIEAGSGEAACDRDTQEEILL